MWDAEQCKIQSTTRLQHKSVDIAHFAVAGDPVPISSGTCRQTYPSSKAAEKLEVQHKM